MATNTYTAYRVTVTSLLGTAVYQETIAANEFDSTMKELMLTFDNSYTVTIQGLHIQPKKSIKQ